MKRMTGFSRTHCSGVWGLTAAILSALGLMAICTPQVARAESLDPHAVGRILSRCTEEFRPVQCHTQVNDKVYAAEGSNRCEALQELTSTVNAQARWFVTLRPQDFSKVICQPLAP